MFPGPNHSGCCVEFGSVDAMPLKQVKVESVEDNKEKADKKQKKGKHEKTAKPVKKDNKDKKTRGIKTSRSGQALPPQMTVGQTLLTKGSCALVCWGTCPTTVTL